MCPSTTLLEEAEQPLQAPHVYVTLLLIYVFQQFDFENYISSSSAQLSVDCVDLILERGECDIIYSRWDLPGFCASMPVDL